MITTRLIRVDPEFKSGFSENLISSDQLNCSICDWEEENFTIFRRNNLLCIESPSMDS